MDDGRRYLVSIGMELVHRDVIKAITIAPMNDDFTFKKSVSPLHLNITSRFADAVLKRDPSKIYTETVEARRIIIKYFEILSQPKAIPVAIGRDMNKKILLLNRFVGKDVVSEAVDFDSVMSVLQLKNELHLSDDAHYDRGRLAVACRSLGIPESYVKSPGDASEDALTGPKVVKRLLQ